ncbi:hypothetical protein WOLCODRAFT_19125 [Wolfiporia cocos MD-104 SS10]|uniref:Uncharacterized protein n=1 Tax=Wolfiporia cocos (strain MD-104) TaxID=742152 RepID=A0A2H3JRG7_WOLCO|nr:hypothetical protein WOLCODRAFT_19125 [Wolfiporia cocos MD-104 SS10]
MTSKFVKDFIKAIFKTQLMDFTLCMEAYLIAGIQVGVVSNHVQEVLELKKQIATLIIQKLRTGIHCMNYNNFENLITAKYGVTYKGWPLAKFCCPSNIGLCNELTILLHIFKTGVAYFHLMSADEFQKWRDDRIQASIVQAQQTGSQDSQDTINNEPSIPTMALQQTTPQQPPTSAPAHSALHFGSTPSLPPSSPAPSQLFPASAPSQSLSATTPASTTLPHTHAQTHIDGNTQQEHIPPLGVTFINAVIAQDGLSIVGTKRQCKHRSDNAPKPKNSQSAHGENILPSAITSTQP